MKTHTVQFGEIKALDQGNGNTWDVYLCNRKTGTIKSRKGIDGREWYYKPIGSSAGNTYPSFDICFKTLCETGE